MRDWDGGWKGGDRGVFIEHPRTFLLHGRGVVEFSLFSSFLSSLEQKRFNGIFSGKPSDRFD